MRLSCPLSGINYSTEVGLGSAKAIHPIFQIPIDQLIKVNLPALTAQKLSATDLHLFGAAILHKLPIKRWDSHLASPSVTGKLWNAQILELIRTSGRLHQRLFPELPHYSIDKDNNDLRNLGDFLTELNKGIDDCGRIWDGVHDSRNFNISWTTDQIFQTVRDVNAKTAKKNRLPMLLANWATAVGNFPFTDIYVDLMDDLTGKVTVIKKVTRTYWRELIIQAVIVDKISLIKNGTKDSLIADYQELISWCETEIPYGSLHSDILLEALRNAVETLQEFKPKFVSSAEWISELKQDAITQDHSPNSPSKLVQAELTKPMKAEPRRNEFPNALAFMKAKLRWQSDISNWREQQKRIQESKPINAGDL